MNDTCPVCRGGGFIAHKQCIDDGFGEVDSCPACDVREAPVYPTAIHADNGGARSGAPDLRARCEALVAEMRRAVVHCGVYNHCADMLEAVLGDPR